MPVVLFSKFCNDHNNFHRKYCGLSLKVAGAVTAIVILLLLLLFVAVAAVAAAASGAARCLAFFLYICLFPFPGWLENDFTLTARVSVALLLCSGKFMSASKFLVVFDDPNENILLNLKSLYRYTVVFLQKYPCI